MRVIPVLDILDGKVVRGVAGRRDAYRPVESRLAESADPTTVAHAFRNALGFAEFYLADLDAILHQQRNRALYRSLADNGFELLVDAGLRDNAPVAELFDDGVSAAIFGLETASGPEQLRDLCARFDRDRIIFSLDLMDGRPLENRSAWGTADPLEIAAQAADAGVTRIIVLELSRIGIDEGVGTLPVARQLLDRFPDIGVITGGGVRGIDDLLLLSKERIEAALVASALHNGTIGREQLRCLEEGKVKSEG